MSRVLMIGAGGVATVAAFKIVQNHSSSRNVDYHYNWNF